MFSGIGLGRKDSPLITGAITRANMRLSAVAGTAFVDFSSAGTLTSYLDHRIRITDSTVKSIYGYIKAEGIGETLDIELGPDPGFDNAGSWVTTDGWSVTGGKGVKISGTGISIRNTCSPSALALYKMSLDIDALSGGITGQFSGGAVQTIIPVQTTTGTKTAYGIPIAGNTAMRLIMDATTQTATVDNFSGKQVLTPSATGVTIVSTQGGEIYNWESQDAGFNYNDSSGYTYTII